MLDAYQGPLDKAKASAPASCSDPVERDEAFLLENVRLTETRIH